MSKSVLLLPALLRPKVAIIKGPSFAIDARKTTQFLVNFGFRNVTLSQLVWFPNILPPPKRPVSISFRRSGPVDAFHDRSSRCVYQGSESSKGFYIKARKNLWRQAATLCSVACVAIAATLIKQLTTIGIFTPSLSATTQVTKMVCELNAAAYVWRPPVHCRAHGASPTRHIHTRCWHCPPASEW